MKLPCFPQLPILIVDDEKGILDSTCNLLHTAGINNLVCCQDSRELMGLLKKQPFSVLLLDLCMPGPTGLELLPKIAESHPELSVIVFTGTSEIETVVECMKAGAFDYMVKPVERNRLVSGIQRALEILELRAENALLRDSLFSEELRHPKAFSRIITNSRTMNSIFRYCETVAGTFRPVSISGETGTGKELIAQAIHELSECPGRFTAVNVAGLDDTVFSDTLFGHVRGAFTGAEDTRKGLIEQAAQGTLFLDEIGDLSAASQVKLLRLIQEREYFPLGADLPKRSDARLIVATNRDLTELQRAGRFRDDLFYRLQVHQIHLPPLRKRLEDVPLLVEHFLAESASSLKKKKPTAPKALYTLLATYAFPGNIRELESMVFEAVCQHDSHLLSLEVFKARIDQVCRPEHDGVEADPQQGRSPFAYFENLPTLQQGTAMLIEEALARADGNQTVAARLLGMTRTSLNKRLTRK